MYNIYLNEEDMKVDSKYPIIALLNEAANENLFDFLENLNKGIGSGYNYSTAYFWNELDEFDKANTEKFEGIMVETEAGDEVIVSLDEVVYYLNILIKRCHLTESDKEKAKELIEQITTHYC